MGDKSPKSRDKQKKQKDDHNKKPVPAQVPAPTTPGKDNKK